jgi:hypothetical protein
MRILSKVVPINTVKRKVIKHKALSTPEEEVTQQLHCRTRSNRMDFFLSPLMSSQTLHSGTPSSNKRSSGARRQRSADPKSGRLND